MSRHEIDVTSLVAGLVFLVGAVTLLVSRTTDVHSGWVLVATLLAFGVAAVVGGTVRMVRGSARTEPSTDDRADTSGAR